ncbi:MAG TPA: RdgB/HAM1 family non-canonical purine NTP pyrophosphatase [Usitatibacter sp.]|nr:RdgB/HAM1 family non-canonical purine NTP pyrophosphatase [Usitatibacter sp.]
MDRVVIASNNPGKLRELSALLKPLGIDAVPQGDFAVTEAEEPHSTFLENALAKARHAANVTGLPALADDSGLCVASLFGEPGVHSAYYAGREGSREERDARNNAKLVEQLRATRDRSAYYYCVLILVRHVDDPTPLVADGTWHGDVVLAPQGVNGFGYDPYFRVRGAHLTAAQLDSAEKNRVSHRGQALLRLGDQLRSAGLLSP